MIKTIKLAENVLLELEEVKDNGIFYTVILDGIRLSTGYTWRDVNNDLYDCLRKRLLGDGT